MTGRAGGLDGEPSGGVTTREATPPAQPPRPAHARAGDGRLICGAEDSAGGPAQPGRPPRLWLRRVLRDAQGNRGVPVAKAIHYSWRAGRL